MRALMLPAPLLAALPAAVQHAPARQKPSRLGGGSGGAMQPLHEAEHDAPSRAPRAAHAALGFKRLHMVLHNLVRAAACRMPCHALAMRVRCACVPRLQRPKTKPAPRMHHTPHTTHMMQVLAAALLGRRAVIPAVPCEFVRAVQGGGHQSTISRFGISHAAFVTSGPADAPTCHVAPATWRHTPAGECHHNRVLHQFDLDRWRTYAASRLGADALADGTLPGVAYQPAGATATAGVAGAAGVTGAAGAAGVAGAAGGGAAAGGAAGVEDAAAAAEPLVGGGRAAAAQGVGGRNQSEVRQVQGMLEGLRRLCCEAAAHADAPLLELRGLDSVLLDAAPLVALLDRPAIPPHEIAQEMPTADWR